MHKVHWIAGLSNGETAHEGKGNYAVIEGERSPWGRLLAYLDETGATITSLSLGTDDGRRWHLPSAGKNPKFGEMTTAPQPLSYKMFRKARQVIRKEGGEWGNIHTVAEATYGNGTKLQVWVSEEGQAWSVLLPQV